MNDKIAQGRAIAQSQAQDQARSIPYRPQYNFITGKVTASILLQQINYWWHKNERKPFYKFRAPCKHDEYREGDSWTEELGMSKSEFDTALQAIGAKITKGVKKSELLKENIVIYWTDSNRLTWYQLNEALFYALLYLAYHEPDLLGKSGFRIYLGKSGNPIYLYSETTTETTTETKGFSRKPEKDYAEDLAAYFQNTQPQTDRERIRAALSDALQTPLPADPHLYKKWEQGLDSLIMECRTLAGAKRLTSQLTADIMAAIRASVEADGKRYPFKGADQPNTAVVSRIVRAFRDREWEEPQSDLDTMPQAQDDPEFQAWFAKHAANYARREQ